MKKQIITRSAFVATAITLTIFSCKKGGTASMPTTQYNVTQTNLIADAEGYNAAKIDPDLVNAWGLAANQIGIVWVSSNRKALSTIYDTTGQTLRPPVKIPSANGNQPGDPTGMVFNSTADFGSNKFIFANENGSIAAWISNDNAAIVASGGQGAVYKGLALATNAGANFLYAANFKAGKIDVFDREFKQVNTTGFTDPSIPAGFGPFNVQNIGGMLYVTYAKLAGPDNVNDSPAPGNGYVNVFKPDGTLVKRFASQGSLNSPWGITHAPAGFAAPTETILVGNFGDGKINIFDTNGDYMGQLQTAGKPIAIEGLWALDFVKPDPGASSSLYFTAGPAGEKHGLFGFLKTSVITNGNNGNNTNNGSSGY
ncbi:MAG: TIGR03118 family protein [Mucilaginibacter sp.]|uniref:TIGR03118 family protein n=1 Tax=Mucilaginibacter sp. TaxID=1882438 RepID=UPI0031AB3CFE